MNALIQWLKDFTFCCAVLMLFMLLTRGCQ